MQIACHNIDSVKENYQLRCALAMLTYLVGATSYD